MKPVSFHLNQWSDFDLYLGAYHASGIPHFFMTPQSQNSKDSRENLHDTSNATDSVKDWRTFWKDVLDDSEDNFENELATAVQQQLTITKQRTVNNFLDTICCALEELSGEEVFECFVEAVQAQHTYTNKEYNKANELLNLLTGL